MVALYLLASHLVGDFILQTRWQAVRKFDDRAYRARHVLSYVAAFVPVLLVVRSGWLQAGGFLAALAALHFATDSRRFHSNVGDVVGWYLAGRPKQKEWQDWGGRVQELEVTHLPANPWPTLPLALDQTLHVAQLALLGGLFLS